MTAHLSPRRRGLRVSSLLWGVAYVALAIAGVMSPTDPPGIVSLLALGHGVTLAGVVADVNSGPRPRRLRSDVALLGAILLVVASVDAIALGVSLREGESAQALWFGAAIGFAVAGVIAAVTSAPSDGAVAAQLAFHGVMTLPALGAVLALVFGALGDPAVAPVMARGTPVARRVFVVGSILLGPLFVTLLAVLGFEAARSDDSPRSAAWTALLVHEAAYAMMAARWAFDGI